jgi:hypothetical protein
LAEAISRQQRIQTLAWLLLDAFSQAYSDNWKKKMQFDQKKRREKVMNKEGMVVKENFTIKKKQVLCIRTIEKMP